MALAVTTTFVCSEPEDGLAPDSDHRSISLCSLVRLNKILVRYIITVLSLPHIKHDTFIIVDPP